MSSPIRLFLANSCPAFAIFFAYGNKKKSFNGTFLPCRHTQTDPQSHIWWETAEKNIVGRTNRTCLFKSKRGFQDLKVWVGHFGHPRTKPLLEREKTPIKESNNDVTKQI
jgi:hypothetical protein